YCLGLRMAIDLQCSGVSIDKDSKDPNGAPCLDLKTVHKDMLINDEDFKAFNLTAFDTLKNGKMDPDDIIRLRPIFDGQTLRDSIITIPGNQRYPSMCTCENKKFHGEPCAPQEGMDGGDDAADDGGTMEDTGVDSGQEDTGTGPKDSGVDSGLDS